MVEQRSIVLTALILALVAAGSVFYFFLPSREQPSPTSLTIAAPSALPAQSPVPMVSPAAPDAQPAVAGAATTPQAVGTNAATGSSPLTAIAVGAVAAIGLFGLTATVFALF